LTQTRKGADIRDRVINEIFSAFHEKAKDITDWQVLRPIAIQAGVKAKDVDEWESTDFGRDQLDAEVKRARDLVGPDHRGVPVIFVQGRYRFDGAPDVGELLEAFSNIRNGKAAEGNDVTQSYETSGHAQFVYRINKIKSHTFRLPSLQPLLSHSGWYALYSCNAPSTLCTRPKKTVKEIATQKVYHWIPSRLSFHH
jgi:hypothetical protein